MGKQMPCPGNHVMGLYVLRKIVMGGKNSDLSDRVKYLNKATIMASKKGRQKEVIDQERHQDDARVDANAKGR